jgi:hypothetical protein
MFGISVLMFTFHALYFAFTCLYLSNAYDKGILIARKMAWGGLLSFIIQGFIFATWMVIYAKTPPTFYDDFMKNPTAETINDTIRVYAALTIGCVGPILSVMSNSHFIHILSA